MFSIIKYEDINVERFHMKGGWKYKLVIVSPEFLFVLLKSMNFLNLFSFLSSNSHARISVEVNCEVILPFMVAHKMGLLGLKKKIFTREADRR